MGSDGDPLLLSFIDVISCGLGAAILLFLLFSVMPQRGLDVPQSESVLLDVTGGAGTRNIGGLHDRRIRVASMPVFVNVTIRGLASPTPTSVPAARFRAFREDEVRTTWEADPISSAELLEIQLQRVTGLRPPTRKLQLFLPADVLAVSRGELTVDIRIVLDRIYDHRSCQVLIDDAAVEVSEEDTWSFLVFGLTPEGQIEIERPSSFEAC